MPVVRLTATNVASLPPGEYTDALLPGFVLRVTARRVRSYGVAAWDGQRKRRVSLGRTAQVTLAEARARAREIIEALAKRQPLPPAPAERSPLTIKALVGRCLDAIEVRPVTRKEWKRLAKVEIIPRLGDRRAAELRRADARAALEEIRSPFIRRQTAAILSRAYAWGLDRDLVETNPCQRLTGAAPPSSDRVLSTLEVAALLRALVRGRRRFPAAADATELLLLTAVRRSAVLGMRREELDGLDGIAPRWIIPAERMKGGRQHVVALAPAAVAVIKRRLAAVSTRHLFPATRTFPTIGYERRTDSPASWDGRWRSWLRTHVRRSLQARQRMLGEDVTPVARWTIHGLRATVATHLREDLDVAPDVVSLLLSHTPAGPAVTRVYDRAAKLAERREALCAWAEWLARLCPHGQRAPRLRVVSRGVERTAVV